MIPNYKTLGYRYDDQKSKVSHARKKFILEELPNSSETEDMRIIR